MLSLPLVPGTVMPRLAKEGVRLPVAVFPAGPLPLSPELGAVARTEAGVLSQWDGSTWVPLASSGTTSTGEVWVHTINATDALSVTFGTIPAGSQVTSLRVTVTTPFAAGRTLSIPSVLDAADVDLTTAATFAIDVTAVGPLTLAAVQSATGGTGQARISLTFGSLLS